MKRYTVLQIVIALVAIFALALIAPPLSAQQSSNQLNLAVAGCPLQVVKINPGGVYVDVINLTGKNIVGVTFNVAIADATENWNWLRGDWGIRVSPAVNQMSVLAGNPPVPLLEFRWNRPVPAGAKKTLRWWKADLDWSHTGGGAFVPVSVLFEDGTHWEEPERTSTCRGVWVNHHRKGFYRPLILPPRE